MVQQALSLFTRNLFKMATDQPRLGALYGRHHGSTSGTMDSTLHCHLDNLLVGLPKVWISQPRYCLGCPCVLLLVFTACSYIHGSMLNMVMCTSCYLLCTYVHHQSMFPKILLNHCKHIRFSTGNIHTECKFNFLLILLTYWTLFEHGTSQQQDKALTWCKVN